MNHSTRDFDTMSRSSPRLTVGLPVYNGERHLPQLIESILAQTFTDFEFLISDNASTDRTQELCLAYAARDPRISYFRNETNIGANANSDLLIRKARGAYFFLPGHDDVTRPTFFAACIAELEKDPGLVLCHGLTGFIGPDGEDVDVGFREAGEQPDLGRYDFRLFRHVAEEADPVARFRPFGRDVYFGDHHYGVIRRSVLLKTRLFEPYYGSDTVLLSELALRGRFKTLDDVLFLRRIHRESSFYLTPEQQQEYAAPGQKRRAISRMTLSNAYARAVLHAESLTPLQRIRCLMTIAGRTVHGMGARIRRKVGQYAGMGALRANGSRS